MVSNGLRFVKGSPRGFLDIFGDISESFRAFSVGFRGVTEGFSRVSEGLKCITEGPWKFKVLRGHYRMLLKGFQKL